MALEIFRLVGSVFVDTDDANKSLQKVDKNAEGFGKTLLNGIGTAAKWAAGIATAAGAAGAALSVASLKSYADYEQLVGGVETLFEDSAGKVLEYAEGAYKTAGLTANAYMETVTSFAASLLQSLNGDTAEAARVADMAITDMSDNANKMGTSIEMIQNAYQGFAKQNYTMLDNLKLGYGGTKTEMERLLADATALSGINYDITNLNDVYQAIHVIQTEIGITGTTAKEATTTISGSISMISNKLENFKTTIGSALAPVVKEFLSFVIDQLPAIESGVNQLAMVWIPALITAISNCATWISENASIAVEWAGIIAYDLNAALMDCVAWLQENRDKVIEWTGYIAAAAAGVVTFLAYLAWGKVMTAAATALKTVTVAIQAFNAAMKKNAIGIIISLISALITWLVYLYNTNEEFRAFVDGMLAAIWAKLQEFIAWFRANVLPTIMEMVEWAKANVLPMIMELIAWVQANALPMLQEFLATVWEKLKEVMAWFQANVLPVIQSVFDWINQNVAPVISALIAWLGETIGAFWAWLTSSFESTGGSVGGIWETIKGFFKSAWDFIVGIWEACQPFFQGIWDGVIMPVAGLIKEMIGAFQMAWDVIKLVWDKVAPYFSVLWEFIALGFKNAWEVIKGIWDMVGPYFKLLWETIKSVFSVVVTVLGGFFRTAWETIKAVWSGVISYFTMVWAGIKAVFAVVKGVLSGDFSDAWTAIKNLWNKAKDFFNTVWTGIKNVFGSVGKWFGDTFKAAWEAIKNVFSAWGSFFGNLWTTIKNTFSKIGTNIANAISSALKAGLNGVISSIESIINKGVNLINGAIDLINKIPGVSIGKLSSLSLPRLEQGAVLEKGQVGLLEGNGAEAVVPLHNNKKWISAVAQDMDAAMGGVSSNQVDTEQFLITIISKLEEMLEALLASQSIELNKREFARLVKEVG